MAMLRYIHFDKPITTQKENVWSKYVEFAVNLNVSEFFDSYLFIMYLNDDYATISFIDNIPSDFLAIVLPEVEKHILKNNIYNVKVISTLNVNELITLGYDQIEQGANGEIVYFVLTKKLNKAGQ